MRHHPNHDLRRDGGFSLADLPGVKRPSFLGSLFRAALIVGGVHCVVFTLAHAFSGGSLDYFSVILNLLK